MKSRLSATVLLLVGGTLLVLRGDAGATSRRPAFQTQTVTVVAGERYARAPGGLESFLGQKYRDLWSTPIEVEVLELDIVAGGLTPVRRLGGHQTLTLALRGADGNNYTFRSVNKTLDLIPPEFRGSGLEDIAQDQISSALPGANRVVFPLAQAMGVLHVDSQLVVMPDNEGLGEFREDFAGVFGTFLEYPGAGFHGATEILNPMEFWERRQEGSDAFVDSRAYLRARLLDFLIGDFDRHHRQWRWVRLPNKERLQPLPEDRDQAFSSYDGIALGLARLTGGQLVRFQEDYPSLDKLAANGADLDRLLLTDLEKSVWMEVVRDVQSRLTDDTIRSAAKRMPPEYYELRGTELEDILDERRDKLRKIAESYYDRLARHVNVHCTRESEIVVVERLDKNTLVVTVSTESTASPYFRRRFLATETDEIRIYLSGGSDRVETRGVKKGAVQVRVIGGSRNDVVDVSRGGPVKFYKARDENVGDPSASQIPSPMGSSAAWVPTDLALPGAPPRDTGRAIKPLFVFGYHADPGLILGAGIDVQTFGFRKTPWSQRHTLRGGFGFSALEPFVEYNGDYRRESSNLHYRLDARASGLDQLRYYGLGNDTSNDQPDDFYRISDMQVTLFPALAYNKGHKASFSIGPILRYSDTGRTRSDTLLAQEQPYGFGTFGQAGLASRFQYDGRDPKNVMSGGVELQAEGAYYPELWDVERPFGIFEGDLAIYVPLGQPVLLSLFTGGRKVWGRYPFFEAAYIGGETTTYGYNWNRFGGDASLYGTALFRWAFQKIRFAVPGELGLTLKFDLGRVFLSGESSNKWHKSWAVGVFYAPFHRLMLFDIGVGRSAEHTFFIVKGTVRFLQFQ